MNDGKLTGHVALVTGAGQGIGAAMARRFALDGARVAAADINLETARTVASEISEGGGEAIAIQLDVSSRSAWQEALARANEAFRLVDIVVNNAGIVRDRSLLKMTDAEWEAVIAVHLTGTFLGCQTTIPAMKEAGWGRIINMSSTSIKGNFGQSNYSAAKGGIVALTRTVALESARHGVLVNAIAPSSVDTPMFATIPDKLREQTLDYIPLGRVAKPSEIAAVAAFLASDDASYVTGQTLYVCGGATVG